MKVHKQYKPNKYDSYQWPPLPFTLQVLAAIGPLNELLQFDQILVIRGPNPTNIHSVNKGVVQGSACVDRTASPSGNECLTQTAHHSRGKLLYPVTASHPSTAGQPSPKPQPPELEPFVMSFLRCASVRDVRDIRRGWRQHGATNSVPDTVPTKIVFPATVFSIKAIGQARTWLHAHHCDRARTMPRRWRRSPGWGNPAQACQPASERRSPAPWTQSQGCRWG